MEISLNGKKECISGEIRLLDFILQKGENPESFVVEYNGEVIKQDKWKEIFLKENDCLEILKFMGGG